MEHESFLPKMFATTQDDRTLGTQFMAQHGITAEHIVGLTEVQITYALELYKNAHEANGIPFTEDRDTFGENLRYNLGVTLSISQVFK